MRVYGNDFPDRLRRAGFEFEMVRFEERVSDDEADRFGLRDLAGTMKADDLYVCTSSSSPG